MMNRRSFAAMAAVLLVAAPSSIVAQTAGATLTVDMERVYRESAAGRNGVQQMKARYEARVNGLVSTYNAAATKLNADLATARNAVKPNTPLPAAIQTTVNNSNRTYTQAAQNLQGAEQEVEAVTRFWENQILRAAIPVAEAIRSERRASAIISRTQALAADPANDITGTLIQRLDQSLKTVNINIPQNPQRAPQPAPARPSPQGR